jgi:hypothetical protein
MKESYMKTSRLHGFLSISKHITLDKIDCGAKLQTLSIKSHGNALPK